MASLIVLLGEEVPSDSLLTLQHQNVEKQVESAVQFGRFSKSVIFATRLFCWHAQAHTCRCSPGESVNFLRLLLGPPTLIIDFVIIISPNRCLSNALRKPCKVLFVLMYHFGLMASRIE
jgi:hypothetical protein